MRSFTKPMVHKKNCKFCNTEFYTNFLPTMFCTDNCRIYYFRGGTLGTEKGTHGNKPHTYNGSYGNSYIPVIIDRRRK